MKKKNFFLEKWFLDFVGSDGKVMIFYAAKLTWHGITVPYTSYLKYDVNGSINFRTRFRNIQIPEISDNDIDWGDKAFKVTGNWRSDVAPIKSCLFDSPEGSLQWNCFHPVSNVRIKMKEMEFTGKGYAEKLVLTLPPWDIPMDDLRWGHFISDNDYLVWIQIRKEGDKNWVWFNGKKIDNCLITDDQITAPDLDFDLRLEDRAVLESEKKIYSVVDKILHYIPGFSKLMPLNFLMADNNMWVSKGTLKKKDKSLTQGSAIHEWVNFKKAKS